MTSAWRASEVENDGPPLIPSPPVGEGGARPAQPGGRVRGRTRRDRIPAGAIVRARKLRQQMGEPERILWRALREALPKAKFRRQAPFGPYHPDFCSHSAKLIVEVDGDEHAAKVKADMRRTRFLEGEGYRVIRFGNPDVMANLEGVVTTIANIVARCEKGRP